MPTRTEKTRTEVVIPTDLEPRQAPAHRNAVTLLADDADALDQPIGNLRGAVTTQQKTEFDLAGIKIERIELNQSYRTAAAFDGADTDGVDHEWVTVSANARLTTLLKKFGDRLLGYDRTRRTFTLTVWFWDVVDAESSTVRLLVRKQPSAGADESGTEPVPQVRPAAFAQ